MRIFYIDNDDIIIIKSLIWLIYEESDYEYNKYVQCY